MNSLFRINRINIGCIHDFPRYHNFYQEVMICGSYTGGLILLAVGIAMIVLSLCTLAGLCFLEPLLGYCDSAKGEEKDRLMINDTEHIEDQSPTTSDKSKETNILVE